MKIQESGENYLEMILMLKNEKGSVRSIDVAHALSRYQAQRFKGNVHFAPGGSYHDGWGGFSEPDGLWTRDCGADL